MQAAAVVALGRICHMWLWQARQTPPHLVRLACTYAQPQGVLSSSPNFSSEDLTRAPAHPPAGRLTFPRLLLGRHHAVCAQPAGAAAPLCTGMSARSYSQRMHCVLCVSWCARVCLPGKWLWLAFARQIRFQFRLAHVEEGTHAHLCAV